MYHVAFSQPRQEGICDRCGGALYQREDDSEKMIRTRLSEYQRQTAPLIAYYREKGTLRPVRGTGGKEEIFQEVVRILDGDPGKKTGATE